MKTRSRITPPSNMVILVDLLVVLALGMLAAHPLNAAYGSYHWLLAFVGGVVVAALIAWWSSVHRSSPWFVAFTLLIALLVLGPALAAPEQALFRVLPTRDSLVSVGGGVVLAWRDALTMATPLHARDNALVVPLLLGLIGGATIFSLLWRTRWRSLAGLVIVAIFVVSALYGVRNDSVREVAACMDFVTEDCGRQIFLNLRLRGILLTVGLILWVRWRIVLPSGQGWFRRMAAGLAILTVASVIGFVSAPHDDGARRLVLRDHLIPPFTPERHPSPLSRFRDFKTAHVEGVGGLSDVELFKVSGVPAGGVLRLAALDSFDGNVWRFSSGNGSSHSGDFEQYQAANAKNLDARGKVTIKIKDYRGPWLPIPGTVTRVGYLDANGSRKDPPVYSSAVAETLVAANDNQVGVHEGETYELWGGRVRWFSENEKDLVNAAKDETVKAMPIRCGGCVDKLEPLVGAIAPEWVGTATTDSGKMAALAQRFKQTGRVSHGQPDERPSRPGHGIARLSTLVADQSQMVGDEEQFASAMAVAAQHLGFPARVAVGFRVPTGGKVKGSDATAWPEVKLNGVGWIAFDPNPIKAPDEQKVQTDERHPLPITSPPVTVNDPGDEMQNAGPAEKPTTLTKLGFIVGKVLDVLSQIVVVVAFTSPIWMVVLFKDLRRRGRRRGASSGLRIVGGWAELLDLARDLGVRIGSGDTRMEAAAVMQSRYPTSNVIALAREADRHSFAGRRSAEQAADVYWEAVDQARANMRKEAPWWRRSMARISPVTIPWRAVVVTITEGIVWVAASGVRKLRNVRRRSTS